MIDPDGIKKKLSDLRKRAEESLPKRFPVPKDGSALSREEAERLVHELRVHQIELEMQNEELREAHNLLSESRDRLSDLYDYAPVGYFTLGKDGLILEVNLTGAALLAADRSSLIGKLFQRFLVKEYADAFHLHRQAVFMAVTKQRCEVELQKSDGTSFFAQLESLAIEDRDGKVTRCRTIVSDITERKRAEALRESEARLDFALQSAQMGVWYWDIVEGRRHFDDQGCHLLGIDQATFTGSEEDFFGVVHPDDLEELKAALARTIEQDVPYKPEYRVVWPDGSAHHITARGRVVRDDKGRPLRMNGILWDVTERERAEEMLRESETQKTTILNGITTNIVLVDRDLRILWVNKAAVESVNKLPGDMMGHTCHAFWADPAKPCENCPTIRALETRKSEHAIMRTPDGRVWDERGEPVFDAEGNVIGVVQFAQDITARVQQERQIRLLNRLYSVLSQVNQAVVQATTPDAFLIETCRVIIEEGGFVLSWIGQVEAETNAVVPVATWGKAGDYVRGITVYADHRPEGQGPTGTCIRERRPSVLNDFLHSPLTQPWSEWARPFGIRAAAGFPIESGGRAWGALTIYSDEIDFFGIEDVKLLERVASSIGFALDNFERERQRRLAEQESERLEAQFRQAQKMEAIGTLAGGIAHDFNNILGIISGFAEISLSETSRTTPLGQNLEQILKAAFRARHLVQQILSFGRKSQTERIPLNASPIIIEALSMLRASLPTTIEICTDIEATCEVQADPTQIYQVLINLCTNAAHAMKEDGGILRISLGKVDYDASTPHPDLSAGPYIKLSVSDTGKGMTPEVVSRIFDPFFTTKGPDEGTGLGLSVVYGIARSHQGAITVDSESGRGSTFNVFLPRIEIKDAFGPEIMMQPPTGKEQILFVDDEEVLAYLGHLMLENLGYKVESWTSSVEALKAFEAQPVKYDLVITDMTMPHMTGINLAKEVVRLRPQIPVILCSGFSDLITPEKAREMGITAMLIKPVKLAELAKTVRQILDDKKATEV